MLKRGAAVVAVVVLCLGAAALVQLQRHPPLQPFQALTLPQTPPVAGQVSVRFAGVSTLLFDDGETAWITDGFFSRPSFWQMLLQPIAPNPARVEQGLRAMGITRLDAVVTLHAHYDHALDAPLVAQRTGARLLGDASTLQLGRGWGLPPARMQEVHAQQTLRLGQFTLHFIPSRHSPTPFSDGQSTETIATPITPPQRAPAWREGQVWSLLVQHDSGGSWLVQGSAGYVPGALRHLHADTVFLGVGTLGKKDAAYRDALWQETVLAVGARQVIPIHWDDFWRPLNEPEQAMPYLFDDFASTLQDLQARAAQAGIQLRLAPRLLPFAPLAN